MRDSKVTENKMADNKTEQITYNEKYILKNNRPWFPIMGEIHYSRCPQKYWMDDLARMKAGGVDIISTYVIWIHHEEVQGEYDFQDNRNLRAFIEACRQTGIYLCLRIGPWSHGEVRNGGFPDWLLHKEFEVRTNDPRYFAEVGKFYRTVFEQAKGSFLKDGGPIIAVQIENEYGHCGGLSGEEGELHMRTLKEMAVGIGFEVPIYTATGWGGAMTGGMLPVMGGYCEAPWDQRLTEIEPSGNYVFTHERNDQNIGSDFEVGHNLTFDASRFPYLTAELGGGLQVTHHRRPVARGEDIGAMSLVKIGSGVNLLGYYMYSGGTNPKGKLTTLQESRASGSINDLPEMSYDFRAPIREYGQISDSYKEIKLLAMFIKDFGEELCRMPAFIPPNNPLTPENLSDLRSSVRHNGNSGYLFINNFQRRYRMADHPDTVFTVSLEKEVIEYPPLDISNGDYFFLPFNMKIGNAVLKSALASPLCILNQDTYVFYTDNDPKFAVEGDAGDAHILTLSKEQARNAYKIISGREYLIITEGALTQTGSGVSICSGSLLHLEVYPDFPGTPEGFSKKENHGELAVYEQEIAKKMPSAAFRLNGKNNEHTLYDVDMTFPEGISDCFLRINYAGDTGRLFLEGRQIGDSFYTGEGWDIGLKLFDMPGHLQVEIFPLDENAPVFLEKWPPMTDGSACEILSVEMTPEYVTHLAF